MATIILADLGLYNSLVALPAVPSPVVDAVPTVAILISVPPVAKTLDEPMLTNAPAGLESDPIDVAPIAVKEVVNPSSSRL